MANTILIINICYEIQAHPDQVKNKLTCQQLLKFTLLTRIRILYICVCVSEYVEIVSYRYSADMGNRSMSTVILRTGTGTRSGT